MAGRAVDRRRAGAAAGRRGAHAAPAIGGRERICDGLAGRQVLLPDSSYFALLYNGNSALAVTVGLAALLTGDGEPGAPRSTPSSARCSAERASSC